VTTHAAGPDETVRTATEADLDDVVALAASAVAEKQGQKGGAVWARRESRREPFTQSLAHALKADDHEVAVGELDGVTVGYGVVHVDVLHDGGRLGVVDDIYVDPRARQLGIGELLMEHLIGWCRDQGCFGVDSLALPGDRSTKNFFESFGLVARAIIVHRPL
jgi:GNAT superfamily N-acetyltransferase